MLLQNLFKENIKHNPNEMPRALNGGLNISLTRNLNASRKHNDNIETDVAAKGVVLQSAMLLRV